MDDFDSAICCRHFFNYSTKQLSIQTMGAEINVQGNNVGMKEEEYNSTIRISYTF